MPVPAQTLEAPHQVEVKNRAALAAPDSAAAEHFRQLLQRIDAAGAIRPVRVVAVTSSARGEGRTTIAANLALTAARDGREVALVECDVRRPSLAQLLELAPRAGLAEVVQGQAELGQALCRSGTLSVLAAGDARDPGAVLRSPRLATTIEALRASFSLVILDAPPALAFADAGRLAAAADGVLLVARAGTTPRQVVRMAVEYVGSRLIGVVLNDVDTSAAVHARYLYAEPGAEAF
jgi:capsular exopolysaccharide synthesis family protein